MTLSDILNQFGEEREHYYNAIAPPIIQSSNFSFPTVADFRNAIVQENVSHVYTRGNNPTVEILRKKLAALEKTDDALVVSSGVTAMAVSIMSCVKQGDHIICVENPYSWTKALCANYLPRFGVTTTFVDGREIANIEAAKQPNTTLLVLESPNTFTYELQDLRACADWAKRHSIVTIIDNSHASPIFQRPAEYGIDMVVHTITKYLNGHSDVVAGVVCGRQDLIDRIFFGEYMTLGTVISPHDGAMILRGLRTLQLRMQRVQQTAMVMLDYLKKHPMIERVLYPMDLDFPQYSLARRQMSGSGGLMTVYLKAKEIKSIETFVDSLQRFQIAVSWGGHESLIIPIAAFYGLEGRTDPALPWNCVRFYFGLEEPEDLISDLEQGFMKMIE
ncbi:MAG TPA: aminotransferase class I/II-fold pyridoxal phosphate-dependent enzyme [Saprospiraceae bacterium]|nr:aminotransferase class I/II-fold pyridoxal phosphate-dependent enzyme [Saprospiraceae bacterium]